MAHRSADDATAWVDYQLAFLRSLTWLRNANAQVGRSIELTMPEMGLEGPARVTSIEPCPTIEPDDGTGRMVVTGTMARPGANILYLNVTGLDEPLGVTDTHPIRSQTRQGFVVAGQLEGRRKGVRNEWHCRFGGKGLGQAAALISC